MPRTIRQVERQLYILLLLSWYQEGITVKELHAKLLAEGISVSPRTIRRDLDDLTLASFPLYEEKRGKTVYFKAGKFKMPDTYFTFEEMAALHFLKELLEPVSFLPVTQSAYRIICQSIANLPHLNKKFIQNLKQYFKVELALLDPQEKISRAVLESLSKAVLEHRVIKVLYYSFSSDALGEREIEPYFITIKNNHYYLIGYCRLRQEVRDFRVSRFRDVSLQDEHFTRKKRFSYQDYIRHSWKILKNEKIYPLKIRFDARSARFVKEYHGDQADRLKELPDGSLLFYRRVAGLEEVLPWVLSFGAGAEVLCPAELRAAVKKHLQQMQALYCR